MVVYREGSYSEIRHWKGDHPPSLWYWPISIILADLEVKLGAIRSGAGSESE